MIYFHACLRLAMLFTLTVGVVWLTLHPRATVGECPGQYVQYASLSPDESQLLLVTLPHAPFG